jgi:DNA-binding MarR family transcriptional regulator
VSCLVALLSVFEYVQKILYACARIFYETRSACAKKEFEVKSFLTLFDLIGVLARRRYQTAERCFAALGLNHTEARLLTLLRQESGVAAQDALSNLLFVDRTNAGRALKRLEQGRYILRRKDDADKRTNLVQITAKGRKAVVEISKLRKKMAQSFFGDLKEDEAGAIVDLLRKALTNEEYEMRSNAPGANAGE